MTLRTRLAKLEAIYSQMPLSDLPDSELGALIVRVFETLLASPDPDPVPIGDLQRAATYYGVPFDPAEGVADLWPRLRQAVDLTV